MGMVFFLVILSSIVLIITFITKNIYVALGTFIVVMYLKKNTIITLKSLMM